MLQIFAPHCRCQGVACAGDCLRDRSVVARALSTGQGYQIPETISDVLGSGRNIQGKLYPRYVIHIICSTSYITRP